METTTDDKTKKILYSIVWTLVLLFFAWPLAWFIAPIWIIILPFESVLKPARDVDLFLEKLITWPRTLGTAIVESHTSFPSPLDYSEPSISASALM